MIGINEVKKYCRDDISKIENYQEAVNSPEKWDCHHRLELTLDGEFAHTYKDLKRMDMYFKRPYFELIFLTHSEHMRMHNKGEKNHNFGKKLSEEHKQRLSESNKGQVPWNKGKTQSEETKKRRSESMKGKNKGKKHSEETKQKMREKRRAYWAKKRALKNASLNTL